MTTPAKPPGLLARLLALFRRPARPRPVERRYTVEQIAAVLERMEARAELDAYLANKTPAPKTRKVHRGRQRDILAVLEAGPLTRWEILERLPGPPATIDGVSATLYDASQAGLVRRTTGRRWALTKAEPGFRLEADR